MKRLTLFLSFILFGNLLFAQGPNGHIKANSSFFPIAVWAQNPKNAAEYKSIGINMFVAARLNQENLDLLKKADMKVIAHLNDFGRANLQDQTI